MVLRDAQHLFCVVPEARSTSRTISQAGHETVITPVSNIDT